MAKLNEDSEFTIPLKNIVGLVAFTVVAVWAYFGVIERITLLERDVLMLQEENEEHDIWITNFKPPEDVMNSVQRVRELELKVKELEIRMEK